MNDAEVLDKLAGMGLELPPVPEPLASYVPVVVTGTTAIVSGQVPMRGGDLVHPGKLGSSVNVEEGSEAARWAAVQGLAALRAAVGTFDRLVRIVQLTVYVASEPDFFEQPRVANGASDLLVAVLGDAGRHARAAVGVTALPLGSSVEVAIVAEIAPA